MDGRFGGALSLIVVWSGSVLLFLPSVSPARLDTAVLAITLSRSTILIAGIESSVTKGVDDYAPPNLLPATSPMAPRQAVTILMARTAVVSLISHTRRYLRRLPPTTLRRPSNLPIYTARTTAHFARVRLYTKGRASLALERNNDAAAQMGCHRTPALGAPQSHYYRARSYFIPGIILHIVGRRCSGNSSNFDIMVNGCGRHQC